MVTFKLRKLGVSDTRLKAIGHGYDRPRYVAVHKGGALFVNSEAFRTQPSLLYHVLTLRQCVHACSFERGSPNMGKNRRVELVIVSEQSELAGMEHDLADMGVAGAGAGAADDLVSPSQALLSERRR